MNFKDKMLLGFILLGLWFLMVLHVFSDTAHSAESAIVSFNDAEHLVALTDSVVGVCDTSWVWPDNIEFLVDSLRNTDYVPKDTADLCRVLKKPVITCREFVDVEKIYPPIRSIWVPQKVGWSVDNEELRMQKLVMKILGIPGDPPEFAETIPGEAIINYRRVTQ